MKPVGEIIFPKMEEEVLSFWQEKNIFQAQNENRKNAKEFSFYDGPPFANGLPHYGHLLANTIKDTVPRYWIMKGYKISRRFGWDCHGLPVEFEIEKREKLKGRPDILKIGIEKFNETCRDSVLYYVKEWQKTITRLGRWVDWDNQYRTMDTSYMESVWWVFAELNRKGLIYKDFKVVPYSPRTASVVSNFEANQNYKNITDPSVFIKFKIKGADEFLLGWTTTPWTLPSNLALAVREDMNYAKIRDQKTGELWILAKDTLNNLYSKTSDDEKPYEIVSEIIGKSLVGLKYEPIFPYFKDHTNAFCVLHAAYVATDEGTGIVHQAPAFGEEDFYNCKALQISLVDPIDETGHFTDLVPDFAGQYFKDADKNICRYLRDKGSLVKQASLVHSYPFDERTDTPLMYKAVPAWYVAVEKIKDQLVSANQQINWVPSHIKDGRMGTWLANARDWAISRNRFWGTPLPVWICDKDPSHVMVFSSIAELEAKASKKVNDIHLHFVKELSFPCQKCDGGVLKNEGLVFDCWFESGSMPYAQLHYPHENKERFSSVFPADFVAEGADQTRGWFYTLTVLSTALFDKPAFKNVIVNGVILDESGKKMSKRHRNYTPPDDLISKYGADSVRLYMLNSPLLRAEDLIFVDQGVKDVTRLVLLPLWNACSFLTTYAHADGWQPNPLLLEDSPDYIQSLHLNDLDRWILSRVQTLLVTVEKHMLDYKLYLVVPATLEFIDDLTNWYIRLSRRRFWGQEGGGISEEQSAAFSTLYYVLSKFSLMLAPYAPFIAERIYRELTSGMVSVPESVHLCDMPTSKVALKDEPLEKSMDLIRTVVTSGRSLRQKHKIKIRQVLPALVVMTRNENDRKIVEERTDILRSELNVKKIHFTTEETQYVRLSLKPNLRTLGARLGAKLRDLTQHLVDLNKSQEKVEELVGSLEREGKVSVLGHLLGLEDFLIDRQALDSSLIATEKGVTIVLETFLTPELIAEGRARELVNRIQNLRKDSGFLVSDRINIQIIVPKQIAQEVEAHKDYILSETLGKHLEVLGNGGECTLKFFESYQIDEMTCIIAIEVFKN